MKLTKFLTAFAVALTISGTTVLAATHSTTASLNMRKGPTTGSARVMVLPRGAQVDSLAVESNGWHKVQYGGRVGYVSGKYLKGISASAAPTAIQASGDVVRVSASLNMRSGPSTAFRVVKTIPKGREAEYLSTAATGWYQVRYAGVVGYISNRYATRSTGATPAPAPTPTPTPTPAPAPTPTPTPTPAPAPVSSELQQVALYYTTSSLNMRAGVGTANRILANIPKGTHLRSLGTSNGWHQVSYGGQTGWVSGTYLGQGTVWMVQGVIIANKGHELSSNFAPGENPEAKKGLNAFLSAGAKAGHNLRMYSGYRSYTTQKGLYNRYVANDGQAAADRYSARPGFSEHQTGLAFDIGVAGMTTSTAIGKHPGGIWMAQNAHRYGFVLSYPEGKESVTGYQYEPWHFRYVGVDMATEVYNSGKTLDEYLGTVSPNYR